MKTTSFICSIICLLSGVVVCVQGIVAEDTSTAIMGGVLAVIGFFNVLARLK